MSAGILTVVGPFAPLMKASWSFLGARFATTFDHHLALEVQDRVCVAGSYCVLGGSLGGGFIGQGLSANDKLALVPFGGRIRLSRSGS